jgi:hypothetical protein
LRPARIGRDCEVVPAAESADWLMLAELNKRSGSGRDAERLIAAAQPGQVTDCQANVWRRGRGVE